MLLEILHVIVILFMLAKYMGVDIDLSNLSGLSDLSGLQDLLNLGGDAEEEPEE